MKKALKDFLMVIGDHEDSKRGFRGYPDKCVFATAVAKTHELFSMYFDNGRDEIL